MPKVEMCEKCGEIWVAQQCKMQKKNGCAVSSIGKVGLLFGFNDSIQSIVTLITPFE